MKSKRLAPILAWGMVINYTIITIWFLVFVLAHDQLLDLHTAWFRMTPEQFDFANYLGMAIYKIGIMLFFLTPYLAIRITERRRANT